MGSYATTKYKTAAGRIEYVSCHIGTAGSSAVLLDVLFAGYALAGRPDSRRVMRWLTPRRGAPPALPRHLATREAVRQVVECDVDDCAWIGTVDHALARAGLTPFKDPALEVLHTLWQVSQGHAYTWVGNLTSRAAGDLLPVVRIVRAELVLNPWLHKVDEFITVLDAAATYHADWTFG
jgi:hypothetical protein